MKEKLREHRRKTKGNTPTFVICAILSLGGMFSKHCVCCLVMTSLRMYAWNCFFSSPDTKTLSRVYYLHAGSHNKPYVATHKEISPPKRKLGNKNPKQDYIESNIKRHDFCSQKSPGRHA